MVLFGGSHGNKKYKKELFFYDFGKFFFSFPIPFLSQSQFEKF